MNFDFMGLGLTLAVVGIGLMIVAGLADVARAIREAGDRKDAP